MPPAEAFSVHGAVLDGWCGCTVGDRAEPTSMENQESHRNPRRSRSRGVASVQSGLQLPQFSVVDRLCSLQRCDLLRLAID